MVENNLNIYAENLDIQLKIGNLLFNILLDIAFFHPDDNWSEVKHNHAAFEIHLIIKGSGILNINNTYHNVSENDCFIIGPGQYHTQIFASTNKIFKYCFKFTCKPTKHADACYPKEEINELYSILSSIKFHHLIGAYDYLSDISDIHEEISAKQVGYYSKIQCLFTRIIIHILRAVPHESVLVYDTPRKRFDDKRNIVIEQFFANNYWSNITIKDLANIMNLSISQVNRVLKILYGVSFKQKLLETRIEIAKDLLCNTDLPINEISKKVGYDYVSSFYKVFKNKTTFTPETCRNLIKSK